MNKYLYCLHVNSLFANITPPLQCLINDIYEKPTPH